MLEGENPTFASIVSFLDSYWTMLGRESSPLLAFEKQLINNQDFIRLVDLEDNEDLQRTVRAIIVLLSFSFRQTVVEKLLQENQAITAVAALAALNHALFERNGQTTRMYHTVTYSVSLMVARYIIIDRVEAKVDNVDQIPSLACSHVEQVIDDLRIIDVVAEELRRTPAATIRKIYEDTY